MMGRTKIERRPGASLRIMLDIDDVLLNWTDLAVAACRKKGHGIGKQVTQWGMHEDLGLTSDEFWGIINHAYIGGMLLSEPYDGTASILRALRDERGHSVHLATARGFEGPLASLVRRHTVDWLTKWDIEHDSLTFTKDKTIVDADVYLDDGIHNVEALQRAGKRAYLRDQPHNRSATHLDGVRVYGLEQFVFLALDLAEERVA